MTANRSVTELTRQELFDLVWSKPVSQLSEDFGISDVAIAKRCKKLSVPRPTRGYWAKIEAGKKPRKLPLPPTADELFVQAAAKPVGKSIRLTGDLKELHSLAAELLRTITSAKTDFQKRVTIRQPTLPNVTVSKALAERTAQAFHAIVTETESRGILFRKGQSSYDGGFFRKGNDRLYLEFEEELVEKPSSRKGSRGYAWSWQRESQIPSGKLTISLNTDRYSSHSAKRWVENGQLSLQEILAQVVQEICRHFIEAQKRRAQEAIEQEKRRVEWEEQQKKWREQEAIRQKEERERKHEEGIGSVLQHRKDDLLKAAEWWRLYRTVEEFLTECERRWRKENNDELKPDQKEWLLWARKTAKALSPFESGYPDPANDGAFSPLTVPQGGPYPPTREFSRPPTMPEIPPPVVVRQDYGGSRHETVEKPYPFWLKHPRR